MSEPPISGPARIFDFRAALWLQLPLIAAAYVAAAWLGYLPTRSGLENLPLHPDAGLALAALLACGLRCWPGVWLGAAITHLWLDAPASSDWLLAAIIASGATLQAVVAALLARRYLQARVPLGREPDVWQFLLLAGPLACLLSASLGTAATALLASTSGPAAAGSWLSWWIGDTLGVLLFTAPMLLAWPGKPPLWEHGGTRVMLPLLITAALLAASNALLAHLEKSQAQEIASKYMEEATNSGFYSLPGYIESLRSIERLFAASGEVTAQEYATFADRVARLPGILSVDWAPRLAGADRASFEATQRPVYALDADGKAVAAGQRAEYYPVLYIAPRDGNSQLIGLDHAHDPQRLAAMQQARDLALPVAVHKRNLVRTRKPVLLVYVPVYRNGLDISQAGLQVRRDALQGFVVGVLDVANLLAPLGHFASRHQLSFRVTDVTPGQSGTVLAGEMPQPADWVREISFGERVLRLELQPDRTYGVAGGSGLARFYLVFSALAAFLVAFAVLGAAGRHAAIASRVADKTADLQAELQARQAAEAALRASEQDLEITLQSIGDAVLATDEHGLVTRMNPVAELLTGWRLDEARGQPVSTVFHIVNEKTRQPADTPVEKVLQSGKQQALANHTVLLVRNGGEHSISESAAPIRNAEGRLCGVVLVFRDVSLQRAAELALQASEERYRQFIERSPYGVFVQCDGKFAFLNPKAVAMLGGESEQQLLGSPVLDFLHPDSRDAVRQRMRLLNEQHVAVPPLEEKWLRLDGSMFFGEATAVPYEYEESSCALVLLNDITARKEAENQLNKFFEISLDMLCIASADGYFKRINPAFSLVLGWDEQELLSRPYMDFVHPDDQAATLREVERQVQSGEKVLSFENRYLHKDGSWRVFSWQSVPHRGGVMFATARDVTRLREADQEIRRLNADLEGRVAERTEALEALHAKQQEVRAILDNMLDCVITIDARGIVRSVNPAVQTLLGYMPEEVIGRNVSMLMSEPPRSDHDGYIASYLHTQVARIIGFTREVEALHKNGGIVPVELAVNKYEVGGEVFFTGSLHDIRERRQLIAELVQARTLAEDASRAKSVFLANMSHEIRTPMNAIIGLSHLCLQTALTDRQRDYVGKVHYSARALLGIINDILDFSKIEAGKLTLEQQDFDLAAVLANVDSVVGHLAREKGLHFEVRRDVAVPQHVMGDALRLGQVLLNLAGNAVKFTQRGSVVLTVLLREEDDGRDVQLEFSVRDTGIGLSEEQVLYIFDPFSQADASTTRKFGGTGLGLTISRRLVDMMGGRLWVDSTLGEGSDFRFTALFRRGSAAPVAARASDDDLAEARRRLHGARLLLAEDNPFNQQVGLELLEAAGASVILADDGEAALKALAEQPCDLVLMDVQMPGMDGYEATRQIRTNPRLAGLRVIAMTANAMAEDRQRCIAAGMDDFITKPIDPDLLYLTLGRWLPQSSHAAPATAAAQPAVGHGDSGVIDLSILGGMLRNNPDKVREFAYKYLQSARDTLAEMQQARSRHDLHELSRLGHRLKSSSRAVGALGFAGLCESLEKCTEWSAAEDLLSRLEQLLQRIEAQVGQELG